MNPTRPSHVAQGGEDKNGGVSSGRKWRLSVLVLFSLVALQYWAVPASSQTTRGRTKGLSFYARPTRVTYGDLEKVNKTCPTKDTCAPSRHDRNGAIMNDSKRRNCFCDQQCVVYDDCCIDSPYRVESNSAYDRKESFQCVTFRQFGSLYMKTTCPDSWDEEEVRKGCEEEKNFTFDPISQLPVTNMRTGYTYKNYFCAICNNQSLRDRLELWKPRLECPSLTRRENQNRENIADNLVYRRDEGNWGIVTNSGVNRVQHWSACLVDPVVPETVEYLVRFCKPSIKDCPEGYNNTDIHAKCLSYTGTVYHLTEGYKNVHCAICNGILPENLMCDQHGYLRKAYQYEFDQAAFSLLFDLNPQAGTNVGKLNRCDENEIFDPFFKKCRSILCFPGQQYVDGECTSKSTTVSNSLDTKDLRGENSNVLEQTSGVNQVQNKFETCVKIVLDKQEYEVLPNGTVYVQYYGVILSRREYAVQSNNKLVICAPEASTYYVDKFGPVIGYLSFAGVLISVICILLHLTACCIVPELRSLSGKNLASLCVALLVSYSMFLGLPFVEIRSTSCTVIAIILYYSFMSAFCWMLVLAWDVSASLRKATQELRISSGAQWTRFFFYSSFGWIFPALLVTVVVVAEFFPAEIMPWPYVPNFGKVNCWFGQKPALLIYFVGPVGFILFLNIILFIDCARLITSTTMGTSKAKACGPTQQNFRLYLRLALLMGISWILGIVAGFVDIPFLWIVFVFVNTLQGLFIFLAFTCSKKTRKMLKAKLCCGTNNLNASWTWSGIVGNNVARSESSLAPSKKRLGLEGKEIREHHSIPLPLQNHSSYNHNNHNHHHSLHTQRLSQHILYTESSPHFTTGMGKSDDRTVTLGESGDMSS